MARLVPLAKNQNQTREKIGGVLITVSISALVAGLLFSYDYVVRNVSGIVLTVIAVLLGSLLLKTTIAIRGLEKHGNLVMESISRNNLEEARSRLSMLVKRDTKDLDRNHVISATLESISENTVDGITGPLFYFGMFGFPGAFVYRAINTIDSMIGYKTALFRNVGWFGANCDKILNYLPARITGLVMILAAVLVKADWKNSLITMRRDGKKTESPNAGYPMAAMAGALGTRFEKINHYTLGNGTIEFNESHFKSAVLLMKMTGILFCILVTVPLIVFLSYLGWWIHV
ncbi:cobalamin biosynthesis protein [Candidatus Nitrosotenuis chungbukensis]|uniref:cobalamin biosynthesis protein n=1 Tax=Candidatus Nitrosotenuis chungbukensis TaxID=1353246 RepID=UPI002A4E214E|nr:cobalamin biosynthesis protein [Candidatus Nitrosotenuis chungbukensis]